MYKNYRTILGEIEPEKGDYFLPAWYAFHGDYKNYEKTKLEEIGYKESYCIAHGCYHHFQFAEWCFNHIDLFTKYENIKNAISAKLIINNDLRYVVDTVYCIWYPEVPNEYTCQFLIENFPQLKYQVARACLVAGYTNFFKSIDLLPESGLLLLSIREDRPEIHDYIIQESHKHGLWSMMSDSDRKVYHPTLLLTSEECQTREDDDILGNTNVVDNKDFKELYDTHDWEYHAAPGDLCVEDIVFNDLYCDLLGTRMVSDVMVLDKIDLLKVDFS